MYGNILDESIGEWRPEMFVGDAVVAAAVLELLKVFFG